MFLDQNLTAGCQVSLTNYDASAFNNQIKKYIDKPFSWTLSVNLFSGSTSSSLLWKSVPFSIQVEVDKAYFYKLGPPHFFLVRGMILLGQGVNLIISLWRNNMSMQPGGAVVLSEKSVWNAFVVPSRKVTWSPTIDVKDSVNNSLVRWVGPTSLSINRSSSALST